MGRHAHPEAFAAVVLAGGYVEAGDSGRHRVVAGDVLVHRIHESHGDRFDTAGAEVLVIPLNEAWQPAIRGRVDDVDALAVQCEQTACDAVAVLQAAWRPARPDSPLDWPDQLAAALIRDPALAIKEWAHVQGLHPGSLARGFGQVFGITPANFRLVVRTHRAIATLREATASMADIALAAGFSDQAHMTRAVRSLTGRTPRALRLGTAMR